MKKRTVVAVAVLSAAVFLILSGCINPFKTSEPVASEDSSIDISQPLEPSDTVYDVVRTSDKFAFETYLSVGLDLGLQVIDGDIVVSPSADDTIVVLITDPDGNNLYTNQVDDYGSLEGFFGVATAVPYVTLSLEGPGFAPRTVTIEAPAGLESVSRTMQIVRDTGVSALVAGTEDTDGDGVPDVYDAYPDDETIAFEIEFPGEGAEVFTVAFEDNFPSLGDGDYNDFVATYDVSVRGLSDKILILSGNATALAKVAGYNHEFGLMFRIPGATGTLSTTLNGVTVLNGEPIDGDIRVPLFPSTAEATSGGQQSEATFTVIFDLDPGVSLTSVPGAPFDPYLYIINTDYDVHLIDQSPLPDSRVDEDEDYRDGAGFPRALLVPSNFRPPQELTSILDAYPGFQQWVDLEGGLDADETPTSDWYFYPNEDLVMDIIAE